MLSLMSVGVSSISHLYFDFQASCKVRFEAPQNYMIDNRISVSLFHIFLKPFYWSSSGWGSKIHRLTRIKEMIREKSATFPCGVHLPTHLKAVWLFVFASLRIHFLKKKNLQTFIYLYKCVQMKLPQVNFSREIFLKHVHMVWRNECQAKSQEGIHIYVDTPTHSPTLQNPTPSASRLLTHNWSCL